MNCINETFSSFSQNMMETFTHIQFFRLIEKRMYFNDTLNVKYLNNDNKANHSTDSLSQL